MRVRNDDTYNTVDEWSGIALSIAVTSSMTSTSLVELLRLLSTISLHLREVEGAVHAARKLGEIDVEGEFIAGKLEHLVLVCVFLEEVYTGRDRVSILVELEELELVALGVDAVLAVIRDGLHDAVLLAGFGIGAGGGVGLLAPVAAVLGSVELVDGMGEGVENEGRVLLDAALLVGAAVGGEARVVLTALTDGLGRGDAAEEQEGGDERVAEGDDHCDDWVN